MVRLLVFNLRYKPPRERSLTNSAFMAVTGISQVGQKKVATQNGIKHHALRLGNPQVRTGSGQASRLRVLRVAYRCKEKATGPYRGPSALGHNRTSTRVRATSALTPNSRHSRCSWKCPESAICGHYLPVFRDARDVCQLLPADTTIIGWRVLFG
jgi:hypothetical protein